MESGIQKDWLGANDGQEGIDINYMQFEHMTVLST